MRYPAHLLKLMEMLKKLPSVGRKTAERFAFDLLAWPEKDLHGLASLLDQLRQSIVECRHCGCISDKEECSICQDPHRHKSLLCVVSSGRELYNIEMTGEYRGLYHVLGGKLSPLEGKGLSHLKVDSLKERIQEKGISEVILALDATLEGDATSLFLKEELANYPVKVSRLAFGIPMGSSLEFIDESTLARAFRGRGEF